MSVVGNKNEIYEVIGAKAFLALVRYRGGTQLWVPTKIDDAQSLAQWIGQEAATRLVEEYGGFRIQVPNLRVTPSADKKVLRLFELGFPDWEIAIIAQVTEQTVRAVRKRQKSTAARVAASDQN